MIHVLKCTDVFDHHLVQAVAAFICNPLSIIWTGSHGGFKGPNCFDILGFNYYNATFHILTDILLAAAPIAVLKNLHMDRKRKGKSVLRISKQG